MGGPLAERIGLLRDVPRRLLGRQRRQQALAVIVVGSTLALSWSIGQAWLVARQGPAAGTPTFDPAMNPGRQAAPAATASLALSPDGVFQQGDVGISGGGFGPLETVIVRVADEGPEARELTRASTDWRGAFDAHTIALPEWLVSGAHRMEAVGERSGTRGAGIIYVRAKERWVNLSSYGVKQAEKLGFVIGGFEPGETVNVYLAQGQDLQPSDDASPLFTLDVDRAGNSSWTEVQVPIVKSGTYSLMFRGVSGGPALSRNLVVSALVPNVELSPWSGPPGSKIELNANGFVPGEDVGVFLGDSEQSVTTVAADEYGNFWGEGPVMAPYEARGQFRVTLIGSISHALVTRNFGITPVKPWVELSTYSGFAGTSVFFSGGGFAAREHITIHVERAEGPVIGVGVANEQGYYRFIGPVNVPPDSRGEVSFVLVGDQSGAQGSATFKVLTPWFDQPRQSQP